MRPDFFPISEDDRIRIERIIASAAMLRTFVQGCDLVTLQVDDKTRSAIQLVLIEIGEAVSRITPATRSRVPDLPWAAIVRMRNVLIHVYWGVDLNKLWDAATVHAPELARRLQSLLPPGEPNKPFA